MERFWTLTIAFLAIALLMSAPAVNAGEQIAGEPKLIQLLSQNALAEATAAAEKLVEADNLSSRAHFLLGECLYRQTKYPEAAIEFKQAFKLKPGEPGYAVRTAEALLAARKYAEAVSLIKQSLDLVDGPADKLMLESLRKVAENPVPPKLSDGRSPEDPR